MFEECIWFEMEDKKFCVEYSDNIGELEVYCRFMGQVPECLPQAVGINADTHEELRYELVSYVSECTNKQAHQITKDEYYIEIITKFTDER